MCILNIIEHFNMYLDYWYYGCINVIKFLISISAFFHKEHPTKTSDRGARPSTLKMCILSTLNKIFNAKTDAHFSDTYRSVLKSLKNQHKIIYVLVDCCASNFMSKVLVQFFCPLVINMSNRLENVF